MNMLHLPIERLAELVDGEALLGEREHLSACAHCAGELESYRAVVAMAADERRRIAPPSTNWRDLRTALVAEGLMVGERKVARPGARVWVQRAAGIAALVISGTIGGRLSAGMPLAEALAWRAFFAPSDSTASAPVGAAQLVSNEPSFQSTDEALAQLEQAQRTYEAAAAFLATHDSTTTRSPDQYRTRLAALDDATETFRSALSEAPRDPILSQYFLATMNAREQTMRRLGSVLPVSSKLGRF